MFRWIFSDSEGREKGRREDRFERRRTPGAQGEGAEEAALLKAALEASAAEARGGEETGALGQSEATARGGESTSEVAALREDLKVALTQVAGEQAEAADAHASVEAAMASLAVQHGQARNARRPPILPTQTLAKLSPPLLRRVHPSLVLFISVSLPTSVHLQASVSSFFSVSACLRLCPCRLFSAHLLFPRFCVLVSVRI